MGSLQPRVFIVSHPARYNPGTGAFDRAYDVSPAREFGTIIYLLPIAANGNEPRAWLQTLQEGLASFTRDDYLLPIGNPIHIGWAMSIAAHRTNGFLQVLEWPKKNDPRAGRYYAISEKLF